MVLVATNSYAAVKAGSACSKAGIKSVSAGKTYTCVKNGKKLFWDKGFLVPVAKPAPSALAKPVVVQAKEGDSCAKMGIQGKDSQGLLECRKFAGNQLKYIRINNDFSPVSNPKSPDLLTLCQLPDQRTTVPIDQQNGVPVSIAYPPQPFPYFKTSTGTFKVVVVGIDFSDVPGVGSPSEIWKDDLVKASQWLKWYTNDKVKLNIVTYPKWIRVSKTSEKYDASNNDARDPGSMQNGGLTVQEINDDYVHAIENVADLSNTTSIWVYMPTNISKIDGGFQPLSVMVKSQKYGLITSQLVAVGADTYLSKRVRWGYFLHEMFHGWGTQGHSPKFIPTDGKLNHLGQGSTAAGWTNALLPWDSLVWGVAKPDDVYCIDKPHLTSVDLKLVPLEREQQGIKSAMVKINDHQVLVVESHRSDKWGIAEGQGLAGGMGSVIDTKRSTAWDNAVTPKDPCITSTGIYLRVPEGNHGSHQPIGEELFNNGVKYHGVGVINGVGIAGDYEYWDLNHIMYTGESNGVAGLKVTLVKGGDNDTVRIENVDNSNNLYIQPTLPDECKSKFVPKRDNLSSSTNTNTNTSQSKANPFPVSAEVSAPSDLKISSSGGAVNLSWVHSSKGSVKIEYYRVRGDCIKGGASCGTYTNDVWSLPSSDGAPMSVQLTQSMLGNPSSGGQWKFYLGAANQTKALSATEMSFDLVTL